MVPLYDSLKACAGPGLSPPAYALPADSDTPAPAAFLLALFNCPPLLKEVPFHSKAYGLIGAPDVPVDPPAVTYELVAPHAAPILFVPG